MKFLALALAMFATSAHAATKVPTLVMTGPDSGKAIYADKCANGGNNDEENRAKFVQMMLANPASKLSQMKADLLKNLDEPRGEGVYIGTFVQSFHDRDGCGSSNNSYSAIVMTVNNGNENHSVSRFLVTIDDDDNVGERTLSLHSIQPITIRDDQ
ncbi:MAG: hypothetical protein ACXVB9_14015 [Bdellovibrionota bacterium]